MAVVKLSRSYSKAYRVEVVRQWLEGKNCRELAEQYGIKEGVVNDIVRETLRDVCKATGTPIIRIVSAKGYWQKPLPALSFAPQVRIKQAGPYLDLLNEYNRIAKD